MSQRALQQAVKLYEDFREDRPRNIGAVKVKLPKAVACIGYVEAIDYRTTHGKKLTLYRHDFVAGSRPLLAVSSDGLQLLLLGGRYKFTRQGIVDKDARGKLITNPKHGKNINPRRRKKAAKCIPVKVRAKQLRREAAEHVKEAGKLERRGNPAAVDYFAMGKKLAKSGTREISTAGMTPAQVAKLLDGYSNGMRLSDKMHRARRRK